MSDIPLTAALAALIRDLQWATHGSPDDRVEVELNLMARVDRDDVKWYVARAEDDGAQRVRLAVRPWRQPRQDTPLPPARDGAVPPRQDGPIAPAGSADASRPRPGDTAHPGVDETEVGLDPNRLGSAHLPPIVRPKPGLDIERDGE